MRLSREIRERLFIHPRTLFLPVSPGSSSPDPGASPASRPPTRALVQVVRSVRTALSPRLLTSAPITSGIFPCGDPRAYGFLHILAFTFPLRFCRHLCGTSYFGVRIRKEGSRIGRDATEPTRTILRKKRASLALLFYISF